MGANLLRKALDVVQLVAAGGELTAREIGDAMQMPKSTTHRLMADLVDVRLLQSHKGVDGDVFTLGGLLHDLTGGQLLWRRLAQHSRSEMVNVRDFTGETVGLHVLFAERRLLIEQVVSQHQHRWVYNNQMVPMPLHAGAAAKMLLAMLPEGDMLRVAKRARDGRSAQRGFDSFLQDLAETRARNYSRSAEEVNPGIASIAVPVRLPIKVFPPAVLSLAGPAVRFTEKVMKRCLLRLRQAAASIAEDLQSSSDIAWLETSQLLERKPKAGPCFNPSINTP